jgi:hypothetical protein
VGRALIFLQADPEILLGLLEQEPLLFILVGKESAAMLTIRKALPPTGELLFGRGRVIPAFYQGAAGQQEGRRPCTHNAPESLSPTHHTIQQKQHARKLAIGLNSALAGSGPPARRVVAKAAIVRQYTALPKAPDAAPLTVLLRAATKIMKA